MGNTQSNSPLILYGTSTHPIHGQVTVYYIKGEAGKFIMRNTCKINKQQLQLFQNIGRCKNQRLVIFYGCDKDSIVDISGVLGNGNHIAHNSINGNINNGNINNGNMNGIKDMNKDGSGNSNNNNNNGLLQTQIQANKPNPKLTQKPNTNTNHNNLKQNYTHTLNQKYPRNQTQKQLDLYWQYFNWDLSKQIQYIRLKPQPVSEQTLWEVIDVCLQAAQYLQSFQLYPQFRPRKIQFTAGRLPKLFWDDILPNNMHRAYVRYIQSGQFRHTVYAPQQLLEMSRAYMYNGINGNNGNNGINTNNTNNGNNTNNVSKQLNTQKCVIFSLGLTLLQAIIKMDIKSIYDYRNRVVSQVKKRQLLTRAKQKCSKQIYTVLEGMLEYFPQDRYGYHELQMILDRHYKRNGYEIIEINIGSETQRKDQISSRRGADQQKSERTQNTEKVKTIQQMALKKKTKSKSVMAKVNHLC